MEFIKAIWQDIRSGQNIDLYVTTIVSLVVAFLGIFGIIGQSIVSAAVLAMLALASISMLQNRREDDSLRRAIIQFQSTSELAEPFLQHQLTSYLDPNQLLSSAHEVFFWGLTFERMVPHIRDTLEQRLHTGLQARFMLLKPESNAVGMAAFRDRYHDAERLNLTLRTSLSILSDLASTATPPAKLEIRIVNYLPPWTIVAFDPQRPTGQMFVSLLTFRGTNETRPSFKLKSREDNEWVQAFQEQFETLWQEAEPVT